MAKGKESFSDGMLHSLFRSARSELLLNAPLHLESIKLARYVFTLHSALHVSLSTSCNIKHFGDLTVAMI